MTPVLLPLAGVFSLRAQLPPPPAAASASYAIWYDVLDGGGRRASSKRYQQVGSFEGFAGTGEDSNLVVECRTGWGATLSNPPDLRPNAVAHLPGQSLMIPLGLLSDNAVDPEMGGLELLAIQPVSSSGAELVLSNQSILFTPTPGYEGNDQFTYTFQDINGATGTSWLFVHTVKLDASELPPIFDVRLSSGGRVEIQLVGVPGYSYHVQASDDLNHWTTMQTVAADSLGRFQAEDFGVGTQGQRFYRTIAP